jgi:hypothetical protein
MPETVLRIGIDELTKVRITVGKVSSEMELSVESIREFFQDRLNVDENLKRILVGLAQELSAAKSISGVKIEFVLPAESTPK